MFLSPDIYVDRFNLNIEQRKELEEIFEEKDFRDFVARTEDLDFIEYDEKMYLRYRVGISILQK